MSHQKASSLRENKPRAAGTRGYQQGTSGSRQRPAHPCCADATSRPRLGLCMLPDRWLWQDAAAPVIPASLSHMQCLPFADTKQLQHLSTYY